MINPARKIFHSQEVPCTPGVYVFRNSAGQVIYVGKARNLRRRMSSYFLPSAMTREEPRRRALIRSIASYEIHQVETESEALLLEEHFIKQYSPHYNTALRDDKRYLVLAIDLHETYPHFVFERFRQADNRTYFGPYPHATALRETVRFLEIHFGIRSCACANPDAEVRKHCLEEQIRGCSAPCLGRIAPEEYRRRIEEFLRVLKGESSAVRTIMDELASKMQDASAGLDFESAAKWRDMIENLKIVLEPTRRFVNETIARRVQPGVNVVGMTALQDLLGLPDAPAYMECFDMSNISGTLAVGAMVLFRDGHPSTSEYRRYKIRNPEAADDTAFMREVLTRRYTRLLRENRPLPDLVVLDGGLPQIGVGTEVFQELEIFDRVPMIGLAERYELIVRPCGEPPILLPRENPALRMLQAIRDEAHRWANGYNHDLRLERIRESALNKIPGVGRIRKMQLLKACGSVRRIMELTPEELAGKVPGLGVTMAKTIVDALKKS